MSPSFTLLDGKKVASHLYEKLLLEVSLLSVVPKIVFIRVGEDPASVTYVASKAKRCENLGLSSETIIFPETITQDELIRKIQSLNTDKKTHGILVQLPLPKHIKTFQVLSEINPLKDVDGLHYENAGLLMLGKPRFVPCTPQGLIEILKFYSIPIAGKNAVVVGRSEIVGKPAALLLLSENATVTICHSKTQNLKAITSQADILIAALGKPQFIKADMVKEGAVVIDVGIHKSEKGIVGDVDFENVSKKVSAITPVPGGVGQMTIGMLMKNLVTAVKIQMGTK